MEPICSPLNDTESEWHVIIIILETDGKRFYDEYQWNTVLCS